MASLKERLSSWLQLFPISTFKSLFQLVWPLFLSLVTQRFIGPINVAFGGRVGTKELGAVGISYGLLAVTATGLGSGLAASFETFAGRAHGAGNYQNIGVLLQKAFLFAGFLCILVTALWIHVGALLQAIGIPPDVAALSELYLLMYIPSMLGIFLFRLLRAYLIVLRSVIPLFIVAFIGVVLLVPLNFFFVYLFKLGLTGIALGSDLCYGLMVVFLFVYILISGIYQETWPGLTKKCFLDWRSYLTLAVPGAFNFLLKSTIHEVALISVGTIGEVEVAAQTALFSITKALLTLPFAMGMPMNINIAKCFGEGNRNEAKTTAIVGCVFNLLVSVLFAVCFIAMKDVVGHIFTNDLAVVSLISKVVPFTAFSYLLESITTVFFIMCLSFRLQMYSSVIYLISSYIIGLPLGISLALYFKDISFLWCGLAVGFLVQFLMFSVLFWWKVDFEEMSKEKKPKTTTGNIKMKTSSEYMPVKTSDDFDTKGDEEESERVENEDKNTNSNSDIEGKAVKPCSEERNDTEDEEVTLSFIGKRCLVLGTSIIILVISIVIRLNY